MRGAVFWDFDGTLTDGHPSWAWCLAQALQGAAPARPVTETDVKPYLKHGLPWQPGGDPTLTGDAFWACLFSVFVSACTALGVPRPQGEAAARRAFSIAQDPAQYRVRPDAPGALANCALKGYKNYILTNNFPGWGALFEKLGLGRYFAGALVSGEVGLCKPDPRIFRRAEALANFPTRLWMVGDNPAADIRGAKAAGWGAIHLAAPGTPHSGADYTVQRLAQVPPLL